MGFAILWLCRFINVSPIIGFLIGGVVVGPNGMGLIQSNETTALLAELGLVFLLFDIGLQFSLKSAWSKRIDLLGLAPLQMLLTAAGLAALLIFVLGVSNDFAILAGITLALSSTAVAMRLLSDMKQVEAPTGKTSKAILIFQDIVAIFLLIFAGSLGDETALMASFAGAIVKTVLAFGAALLLGRFVLAPVMRMLTRYDDPELYTIFSLFLVMVMAVATAEVGLSLTLGAFLAGMVLAETPFRILLQTELRPFRNLFLAFLFINVGMIIQPAVLAAYASTILAMVIVLVAIKGLIIAGLMKAFGRPKPAIIEITTLLSQGSEFAFVIFSMAGVQAGLGDMLAQQLIAAVAISMMLTPLLNIFAYRWSLKACDQMEGIANCPDSGKMNPFNNRPVFIVGMNEVGKTLARSFQSHNIPYVAVVRDRQRFMEATAAGYTVAFGQPEDLRFWGTLGVKDGLALCVAAPHFETAQYLAPIVQRLYPQLKRYVAVKDSSEGTVFADLGMIPFQSRGAPPGLEMACFILRDLGIADERITLWSEIEQNAYLHSYDGGGQPPVDEKAESYGFDPQTDEQSKPIQKGL
ncbi:MAG TPA: cation:proton antiporter [Alphaproteobacteria bacterium]|nr:cation:proton antiporter [Alphaproteobacteria bacterium]